MIKRVLNKLRGHHVIAALLRFIFRPIQKICHVIDTQIKMKVWANGTTVTYDGVGIRFPKNIGVSYCSAIYWNDVDGFEPNTWRIIRHFLERSDKFIDIGSNIGFYSVLASKVNAKLDIAAYEPVPSIFKKNLEFHKVNNLQYEHIENAAIGEFDGDVEIYLPIDSRYLEEQTTATLRKDSWQFSKEHETFKVRSIPLDKVLGECKASDKLFIKIDVEDYESGVFKSGAMSLSSLKPAIVCEILPRDHGNQETIKIIEGYGYIAFGISSDGLLRFSAKDFIGPRNFTDFLLLHNSVAPNLNFLSYRNIGTINW